MMGQQIIKQPNGRYCIFSSVVDNVTYYDLDRDEIVQAMVDDETRKIERHVDAILHQLGDGKKPYYQFTMGYGDMLTHIACIHDRAEADKVRRLLENPREPRGCDSEG